MHRFFLESEDQVDTHRVKLLNSETVNHLVRVLRVKKDEAMEIVTENEVWRTHVEAIGQSDVSLYIDEKLPHQNELPFHLDLFQCLPKGQKFRVNLAKKALSWAYLTFIWCIPIVV